MPVSLTYKGKRKFGTAIGGFVSLVQIVFFMSYSIYSLHKLILHPKLKNNSEKLFVSYDQSSQWYNITTKSSTLAVMIDNSQGVLIGEQIDTTKYLRVVF